MLNEDLHVVATHKRVEKKYITELKKIKSIKEMTKECQQKN
jgi:hypothetical protein